MSMARAYLKNGREKSIARRHPWIFSGAVERVEGKPAAGETVEVLAASGAFLARAAYSPQSQIRLRVWTFDEAESVDSDFFRGRIARAIESRRRLGLLADQRACRLVFSESDGLPGLIADRYAEFVVCQFLSAGADFWRATIAGALYDLCSPAGVYERSEAAARRKEGLDSRRGPMLGAPPPPLVEIRAGASRHLVDVTSGQKTGAYLDQQANRARVAAYAAPGARMLDGFSYTGGFAIAGLAAGAASARLIDASGAALVLARREAELNGVAGLCEFVSADVFDELRELKSAGAKFDLIVLDPPKFVHSAEQVRAGSRGYKDVNMVALGLVSPGGVLATFSCSAHVDAPLFQKIVAGAAIDAGRGAQILERLGQPADHPVALEFPESEYLKGLILRVH
jgi:23S rRNA (cytosine1962-C5)-methyltransferase